MRNIVKKSWREVPYTAPRIKDTLQAYGVHYRPLHKEKRQVYTTQYRAEHPEVHRKANAQRRARRRSLPATWTPIQQAFMLDYWQHACAVCGNPKGFFWDLANDHWIASRLLTVLEQSLQTWFRSVTGIVVVTTATRFRPSCLAHPALWHQESRQD